jgi:pimeloyl-ACP methyl ester carboxylesterase
MVTSRGSGPPLVLSHGLGSSGKCFDGQQDFIASKGYELISWDLPGHGSSRDAPGPYAPQRGMEALSSICAQRRKPVILLGHSLGGFLSLRQAVEHPESVRALILISTGPGYRNPGARAAWNSYIDRIAPELGLPDGAEKLGHQEDSLVADSLPAINVPVLHLFGAEDQRYRDAALYLEHRLPCIRTITILGAHHNPQISHAAVVNDAIGSFLDLEVAEAGSRPA